MENAITFRTKIRTKKGTITTPRKEDEDRRDTKKIQEPAESLKHNHQYTCTYVTSSIS